MGQQLQAHHQEHCKRYEVVKLLFHAIWVSVNLHNSPYLRVQISEAREKNPEITSFKHHVTHTD